MPEVQRGDADASSACRSRADDDLRPVVEVRRRRALVRRCGSAPTTP